MFDSSEVGPYISAKWVHFILVVAAKLRTQALILIYCTIDILAWLTRPTSQPDVQRKDFISWVEKYILPNTSLTCNAIDLYAARCALVHSYISESKLSREGKAKQIFYVWGNADEEHLQKLIDAEGSYNAVSIHIDKLYDPTFRRFRTSVFGI